MLHKVKGDEHACKGPSIYDFHTEGEGSGGCMWMGRGGQLHVDVHRRN